MTLSSHVGDPVEAPKTNFRKASGVCRNPCCGQPLRSTGRRSLAKFCSEACHRTFHNRQKVQGRQLVNIAKRWRRYKRPGDFTLLTRLLDQMIADDKAIGLDVYPEPPIEASQIRVNIALRAR